MACCNESIWNSRYKQADGFLEFSEADHVRPNLWVLLFRAVHQPNCPYNKINVEWFLLHKNTLEEFLFQENWQGHVPPLTTVGIISDRLLLLYGAVSAATNSYICSTIVQIEPGLIPCVMNLPRAWNDYVRYWFTPDTVLPQKNNTVILAESYLTVCDR